LKCGKRAITILAMPEYSKDVMIAVLAAAVGLAGLLLVVAGFAFAQASSFPSTTDDEIIKKYETAAKWGVVPFLIALADAAISLWWLLHASPYLFSTAAYGFFLLLLLTAAYGSVLILRYL
jgi:Na+(H+)/acetate symporter ActP